MKTVKSLLLLTTLILLSLTSCNKDKEAPAFTMKVNGVDVANETDGIYSAGSTVEFAVSATDDEELTLYEIRSGTSQLSEGVLSGSSDAFTYSYTADPATPDSTSVVISFLVQDAAGNSTDADHTMIIIQ